MAKKDKNVGTRFIKEPRVKPLKVNVVNEDEMPKPLKRRAKFFPDLIAEGLLNGVSQTHDMLLHGEFDDATESFVDPAVDLGTDKFDVMGDQVLSNMDLTPASDVPTE